MQDPEVLDGPLRELPRDLSDLESGMRRPRILQPRPRSLDPDELVSYRPLLPRHYREYLRTSPYPRLAGVVAAVIMALAGVLWVAGPSHANEQIHSRQHHATRLHDPKHAVGYHRG